MYFKAKIIYKDPISGRRTVQNTGTTADTEKEFWCEVTSKWGVPRNHVFLQGVYTNETGHTTPVLAVTVREYVQNHS